MHPSRSKLGSFTTTSNIFQKYVDFRHLRHPTSILPPNVLPPCPSLRGPPALEGIDGVSVHLRKFLDRIDRTARMVPADAAVLPPARQHQDRDVRGRVGGEEGAREGHPQAQNFVEVSTEFLRSGGAADGEGVIDAGLAQVAEGQQEAVQGLFDFVMGHAFEDWA